MSLIIAVDVDDTVADLLTPWLRRYNERFPDEAVYKTPEDVGSWNLVDAMPEHHRDPFWAMLDPSIYNRDEVQPIPGALEAVQRLRTMGRVVFVTSCVGFTASVNAKFHWLVRHGFLPDAKRHGGQQDFVPMIDKSLIKANFLIDDGPHNIQRFQGGLREDGRAGILIEHPHNWSQRSGMFTVPHISVAADEIQRYLEGL